MKYITLESILANTENIYTYKNGFTWVKLLDNKEIDKDGKRLKFCVNNYSTEILNKKYEVYSLRDRLNRPYIILEYKPRGQAIMCIRGENNNAPIYAIGAVNHLLAKKLIPWKSINESNLNKFGMIYQDKKVYCLSDIPNFEIEGDLDLSESISFKMSDNITINGSLDLQNSQITQLPNSLTINGNLDLRDTKITKLPKDLKVTGDTLLNDYLSKVSNKAKTLQSKKKSFKLSDTNEKLTCTVSETKFEMFKKKIKALSKKGIDIEYTAKEKIIPYPPAVNRLIRETNGRVKRTDIINNPNDFPSIPWVTSYDVEMSKNVLATPISGYKVIGVIDHIENMVLQVVEGIDIEKFRNRCVCDHCKSKRNRNKTVIVMNDKTGDIRQIGTTCLSDYLGHDMSAYLSTLELYSFMEKSSKEEDEEDYENYGRQPYFYPIKEVFAIASWCIDKWGFKPSSEISSTKDAISAYLSDKDQEPIDNKYYEKADKIIKWFKHNDEDSNFINNIKQLVSNEHTTWKYFGYIAAGAYTYNMRIEKEKKSNKSVSKSNKPVSEWIGTEGEKKHDFGKLTVTKILTFEGMYGITHYYFFIDKDNNVVLWKTNKSLPELVEGAEVNCVASIKAHDEYRGTKQTIIIRPVLLKCS